MVAAEVMLITLMKLETARPNVSRSLYWMQLVIPLQRKRGGASRVLRLVCAMPTCLAGITVRLSRPASNSSTADAVAIITDSKLRPNVTKYAVISDHDN